MKIANRDARSFVQRCHPFEGSNLYGSYYCVNPSSAKPGDSGYVVYSYGEHWPLFICVHLDGRDRWFENRDRATRTTSRHHSQVHPHCETTLLEVDDMRLLRRRGFEALVIKQLDPQTHTPPWARRPSTVEYT